MNARLLARREAMRARRKEALKFARNESKHGGPVWAGLCQKFTRTGLGAGPGAASAIIAWETADDADRYRDDPTPPAGVPVYWRVGRYGHAAISAGRGYCWSTDIKRRGHVDKVRIDALSARWGAEYLGWLAVINGERVWPRRKAG